MSLIDFIKSRHAKSLAKEAKDKIVHFQFTCFIFKPFIYIYSVDMINTELKPYELEVEDVKRHLLFIVFAITRVNS